MIFRMAGKMGVDPAPWSLRELFWMFEGWNDTRDADLKGQDNGLRSLLAAIINTVSTKPIKPSDLKHEGEEEPEEVMTEEQALGMFMLFGLVEP